MVVRCREGDVVVTSGDAPEVGIRLVGLAPLNGVVGVTYGPKKVRSDTPQDVDGVVAVAQVVTVT